MKRPLRLGARATTTIAGTLLSLVVAAACGDDAATDDATAGTGGTGSTSTATTAPGGTGGAAGEGGQGGAGAGGLASILAASGGALLRVRVDAETFTDDDDQPGAWRLDLDGVEVALDDPAAAGVLGWRATADADRIVAVYLQVRVDAAAGAEVVVERRATGERWVLEARPEAGARFVLDPIVVRDTEGAGSDADVATELSAAWSVVDAACGIALEVAPPVDAVVDDPEALVRGITAIDDEERPAALLVPSGVDEIFDASGFPDEGLRILIWPGASALAIPPRLHEFAETFGYVPSVMRYDAFENGELIGGELTDAPRYRFALSSDEDSESPQGEMWPWALIAIHEIGHMLGLSHPDATSDASDDFTDNLMAGAHGYPDTFGEVGAFPNVTQRQCLQMGLDLNGFGAD